MPVYLVGLAVVLLLRFFQARRGGNPVHVRWRSILYAVLVSGAVVGVLFGFVAVVASISYASKGRATGLDVFGSCALFAAALGLSWILVSPWSLAARAARRGNPTRAYWAAHFLLLFHQLGEPTATACMLGLLALAIRGEPTRAELDWLGQRLDREKRALGSFGVAFGLLEALEGNLARREGREQEARDHRERARVLFGTTTYLSPAAMPSPLRTIANDYLVLDSVRRGEWGVTESLLPKDLSPVALAIRDWVRAKLLQKEDRRPSKTYGKKPPPKLVAVLDEREEHPRITDDDAAFAMMSRDYVALVRGQRPSPRALLNLLTALDAFFDPRSPKNRLPPEIASDDEAADAIAESIADAVALALRDRGAPVFALRIHGAISARVYQKLESVAASDLTSALKGLRERTERRWRGTPKDEWLEVSRVRGLYRTIEFTLGTQAAGAFAAQMFYDYGRLGVMLSETAPRRRPLAHAVFHCLHDEALRFGNHEAGQREAKNMRVTSHVD